MSLQDEIESAKDSALRLLSYCPRTTKEIYDRLKEKGFSKVGIEKAVIILKETDLLDDLKFARDWISLRLEKEPLGIEGIKEKLSLRGIDEKTIDKALLDFKEALDEYQMAKRLLVKRLKTLRDLEPIKAVKRLYPYLRRQGFSEEVVEKVLREKFDISIE